MSTYLPIEAFEEDGVTRTPDFGYVASNEEIESAAQLATQGDVFRGEKSAPIGETLIGVQPFPNPHQRAYGIQGLLNKANEETGAMEATPLGEAIWTAIKAIFGVASVVRMDETTFGVTISLAFTFESVQDGKGSIHDQIMTILNEHIMLHPEREAADTEEDDAPDPAQAPIAQGIIASPATSNGTVITDPAGPSDPTEPPVAA